MILLSTLIIALVIDHIFGEPDRFHPLVLFGTLATKLEQKFNKGSNTRRFLAGVVIWIILVAPLPFLYLYLQIILPPLLVVLVDITVVYWAVALNSLTQHGMQIFTPLINNDLNQARHMCSYIVSRDTSQLDAQAISRATTESNLENGHDAVLATLIYFVIGGAPLVIAHRLSNTLDAMWGYRSDQFNYFGKFSARMDDLLGFLSAKITVVLFGCIALLTRRHALMSFVNAFRQSRAYKSHNGGWVIASGATVLNVCLGGRAVYFGAVVESPILGQGDSVQSEHIIASLTLVKHSVWLWLLLVFVSTL